jgi:hypothetical protein
VVLRAVSDSLSKLCSASSTPLVRVDPSDLLDIKDFWREMAAGRVLPFVLNIDLQGKAKCWSEIHLDVIGVKPHIF